MTSAELIEEGRRLQRPAVFLRPEPLGEIAAVWHSSDEPGDDPDFRPWLTVDARHIPGLDAAGTRYLTISTNEEDCKAGRVESVDALPAGEPLYAHPAAVLPPIDAVFALGSDAVGEWLQANKWQRQTRYNDNFKDSAVTRAYQNLWMSEHPLYLGEDIAAVLGGWHLPGADDDWHDLIAEKLLAMTLRDSEPWVEAWQLRSGGYSVIQRTT